MMKSYLTYITEIDKGPKYSQSFPDGGDPDRFKISRHFRVTPPEGALPDAGFDPLTGKEIGKEPVIRPSKHYGKELNPQQAKEVDRLRQSQLKSGGYTDVPDPNKTKFVPDPTKGTGELGLTKKDMEQLMRLSREFEENQAGKPPRVGDSPEMKSAMKDLDAQRSASPSHRPPGTPKNINKKALDRLVRTPPELLDDPKVLDRILRDIENAPEIKSEILKTPQATKVTKTPSMLSRIGSIAKTVAKNPLVRAGGKALGVVGAVAAPVGMWYDAQAIADKLTGYEAEEMERRKRDPNRSLTASNLTSYTRSPGTKF